MSQLNNTQTVLRYTVLLCERPSATENEYVSMLTEAYREAGYNVFFDPENFLYGDLAPEIVHLQWPEAIYDWRERLPRTDETLAMLEQRLGWFCAAGSKIVSTYHNRLPHDDATDFDSRAYRIVYGNSLVVVHHGAASITTFRNEFPDITTPRHIVCPHGPYAKKHPTLADPRSFYGILSPVTVVLNFGRQRPYKGGSFTRSAVNRAKSRKLCLFTVGSPSPKPRFFRLKRAWFNRRARIMRFRLFRFLLSTRFAIVWRTVPSDEIADIMQASDVVFLPHANGLNTGLIPLAVTYSKPVVFPDIGNFVEQACGWPFIETYEVGNEVSAAQAIEAMLTRLAGASASDFDNSEWLRQNSWSEHVKRVLDNVGNSAQ